jgi:hypothetical protein
MKFFSVKKQNRRRRTKPAAGTAILRTIPRLIPRPRLPRGRKAVVSAALLGGALLALWPVTRACLRGDLLTVSRIEVTGNHHWSADVLLAKAGLEIGQRAFEIPFRAARKNLLHLPGVESATVRYLPGGRLRVSIREAEVVAMMRSGRAGQGWRGLTPGGDWMPLSSRNPEDVPIFEGAALTPRTRHTAAAWLSGVRARHPDLFAGFSQLSLRGSGGEADVYWRDGRVRLRVDCSAAGEGSLAYLGELLRREQGNWAEGATVDLRVEGYAYVR